MPVSLLLCEGGERSPDVRVLAKLLAGRCQILPLGGKYKMGDRILARREALGRDTVFGLLDGDFARDWAPPTDRPRDWKSSDGTIIFGWRWERKEIENYLLDPAVVAPAFSQMGTTLPAGDAYQRALETARDQIAHYQAARAALAASRIRFKDLPSSFGREHPKLRHTFPDQFDESSCRDGLRRTVREHAQTQAIDPDEVEASYTKLLPQFLKTGPRNVAFLHAFAGKDILLAIDATLRGFGFPGARVFREKVLIGLEQATDDIADWIPEWKQLRELMDKV